MVFSQSDQSVGHQVNVGGQPDIQRENERLRRALEKIRDEYGQVCEGYMTCTHESCRSSYSAWATADIALSGEEA